MTFNFARASKETTFLLFQDRGSYFELASRFQNWELKQEFTINQPYYNLSKNYPIEVNLQFWGNRKKSKVVRVLLLEVVYFFCCSAVHWCFILTLNRASALSGKRYEQNFLLLYEPRCNRKKNRFRVKANESLFFSPPWGCFILTLNRASALSGSRYELNFLLLYKPRCNEIKNRFRVKTNESLFFSHREDVLF